MNNAHIYRNAPYASYAVYLSDFLSLMHVMSIRARSGSKLDMILENPEICQDFAEILQQPNEGRLLTSESYDANPAWCGCFRGQRGRVSLIKRTPIDLRSSHQVSMIRLGTFLKCLSEVRIGSLWVRARLAIMASRSPMGLPAASSSSASLPYLSQASIVK